MSDWNEELPKFKERRLDTENLRPTSKGKRQPRKWRVYDSILGSEYVAHRAATEEAAKAWIDKQARGYYVPRRNVTQAVIDDAVERAKARAAKYRIEPPSGEGS